MQCIDDAEPVLKVGVRQQIGVLGQRVEVANGTGGVVECVDEGQTLFRNWPGCPRRQCLDQCLVAFVKGARCDMAEHGARAKGNDLGCSFGGRNVDGIQHSCCLGQQFDGCVWFGGCEAFGQLDLEFGGSCW